MTKLDFSTSAEQASKLIDLSRKTVKKYIEATEVPRCKSSKMGSILDKHYETIKQAIQRNKKITLLHQELIKNNNLTAVYILTQLFRKIFSNKNPELFKLWIEENIGSTIKKIRDFTVRLNNVKSKKLDLCEYIRHRSKHITV